MHDYKKKHPTTYDIVLIFMSLLSAIYGFILILSSVIVYDSGIDANVVFIKGLLVVFVSYYLFNEKCEELYD